MELSVWPNPVARTMILCPAARTKTGHELHELARLRLTKSIERSKSLQDTLDRILEDAGFDPRGLR
jgi:hypothetical protein